MKVKKIAFGILINIVIGAVLLGTGIFFSIAQAVSNDRLLTKTAFNQTLLDEKPLVQARQLISDSETKKIDSLAVTVSYKGRDYVFKATESGVGNNVQVVLSECFGDYKQAQNAFDKLKTLYAIRNRAAKASVKLTVDETVLREKIHAFAESVSVAPVDAQATFHASTRSFDYTDAKNGTTLDEEEIFSEMKRAFLGLRNERITAKEIEVRPNATREDAVKATQLIGRYTTKLNSNTNRNKNVALMSKAFNGQALLPGQTISANELVGERTEDKGFMAAPAIKSGFKIADELGGGICQATGTLYNAVLLSGLKVVKRNRHSWPSDYLPIGQDAMVDWPNKDFAFTNNTKWPIYVSERVEGRTVIAEIFGPPQEDGSEVRINTQILRVTNPKHKRYIRDTSIRKGRQVTEVAERIGYDTRTTREYYIDNKLARSELISEDHYPAVQGIIRIGAGGGNK
jgi:vancomycin resistance protein YoaR